MDRKVILFINDQNIISQIFSKNGFKVYWAENEEMGLKRLDYENFDLVLFEPNFSFNGFQFLEEIRKKINGTPIIVIEEEGSIQNAVVSMQKGAFDYLLKSYPMDFLRQRIEMAICEAHKNVNKYEKEEFLSLTPTIITQDKRMIDILDICKRISSSTAPVLIQGESGTGKELIARYIHFQGPRSQEPFIAVNCAALPESLFESELFGHEKGAFTGAIIRKIGKFELANKGTILLDEISEMSPYLQAKLLRVLQENEIDRIGGKRPIPVDVRVIATTNQNLLECIKKGTFREDLFFRLNVVKIEVPPLRERPGDIGLLIEYFQKKYSALYCKPYCSISNEAVQWLKKQIWRGNVRELKNVIERAVLTSTKKILEVNDFSLIEEFSLPSEKAEESTQLCLKEIEKKMIKKALEKTGGNRTHAARILGISIRTLRNKLNEYKENLDFNEM